MSKIGLEEVGPEGPDGVWQRKDQD
jgi:hypothetical protein